MEKALQLPVNYVELGQEEMMQLEGGRPRRHTPHHRPRHNHHRPRHNHQRQRLHCRRR